jgi:hypothetical protein
MLVDIDSAGKLRELLGFTVLRVVYRCYGNESPAERRQQGAAH